MKQIKVLVVEDQTVVREGVVAILSFQPDIEVVGEAHDGLEGLQLAQQKKPDVLLLDLMRDAAYGWFDCNPQDQGGRS